MFRTIVSLLVSLVFLSPLSSHASGPGKIAKADRALWPYKIDSNINFDTASKCEMLVFAEILNQFDHLTEVELAEKIDVKKINAISLNKWKEETKARIIDNFKSLSDASLKEIIPINKNSSWENISAVQLKKQMPDKLKKWYESAKNFYDYYLCEQLRLASLYPRITSEIMQLSKNEIQGHNFPQKQFLLTFDDGPTVVNGNTDKLVKVLDNNNLTGMFFVLGNSLNNRLKASSSKSLRDLYGQNMVVSHGKEHLSHQKYVEWKTSLDYTNQLIHEVFPTPMDMVYFRPPYGQRNQVLLDYVSSNQSKIILWNMDSQDWSANINAQEVADREITLMLLWRKGILLFHDIHSKAQTAVPIIYNYFKGANIIWMSPKNL